MWVKICGITNIRCAKAVCRHRPDAIGLNFYAKSKRCVPVATARDIVSQLPFPVTPIGLFVNHSQAQIREITSFCGLRWIQLHGDETPEFAAGLTGLSIIRAFRIGPAGLGEVARQLEEYARRKVRLQGCLIDAHVPGSYGGTGQQAPWEMLAAGWQPHWPPLILAGGLTPDNLSAAMAAVAPWGVDVASGVESSPGRQDSAAVGRFVTMARTGRPAGSPIWHP